MSEKPNPGAPEEPAAEVAATGKDAKAEALSDALQELREVKERLKVGTETFLTRTWHVVDVLLAEGSDPMLAATRAYWAVYNVSASSAHLLELEIDDMLEDCADAPRGVRVPHSKIALLVSRIFRVIEPPKKIGQGQQSKDSQAAFALCRELQKIRKRSDYMGFEQLSGERAHELIGLAKELCSRIWRFTCDNYRS